MLLLVLLSCDGIVGSLTSPLPIAQGTFSRVSMTENSAPFDIVSRKEWNAKTPILVEPMPNPVPYVIIHHSHWPSACFTLESCKQAMRDMQDFHQQDRGWNDIGYSFAVGSDGRAYMGRGWSAVGAHAPHYNNQSIGICIIGDWTSELPPAVQLVTAKKLIDIGVQENYISPNYTLLGHRQVRDTECPGDRLFTEIKTWDHFSPYPSGATDTSNAIV